MCQQMTVFFGNPYLPLGETFKVGLQISLGKHQRASL